MESLHLILNHTDSISVPNCYKLVSSTCEVVTLVSVPSQLLVNYESQNDNGCGNLTCGSNHGTVFMQEKSTSFFFLDDFPAYSVQVSTRRS